MTTLHYDVPALERAVDAFPAVQSVSVAADLPETLRIRVREHRPVAALESGDGRRVAVASDGTLLPRSTRGSLPAVKVDSFPAGPGSVGRPWKSAWFCVWRAPGAAAAALDRAYRAQDGVRVAMRTGPTLRFGAPARVAAKWAAVTRVLADPSSGGASLLDVRLPNRPAASFDGDRSLPRLRPPTAGTQPAPVTGATGTDRGAARPRGHGNLGARRPCSLNPESRVRTLQHRLTLGRVWAGGGLQLADRAMKLVQNIAWMGNFSYRAEPRRVRERG